MAFKNSDFKNSAETIKAARIKQRAYRFWLDYHDLRKKMDNLIKTGYASCSNMTVWRNMNAKYGKGKIRLFGGSVEAYVFSGTKVVSFNIVGIN